MKLLSTLSDASMIAQNASFRFVTDAEKATWNGKQNTLGFTPVNKTGDTINGQLTISKSTGNTANERQLILDNAFGSSVGIKFNRSGAGQHDWDMYVMDGDFKIAHSNDDTNYTILLNISASSKAFEFTNLPVVAQDPTLANHITRKSWVDTQVATKEPVFSKNSGFNKNFGSVAGTVTEGNDSRLHTPNLAGHSSWANQNVLTTSNVTFNDVVTTGKVRVGSGLDMVYDAARKSLKFEFV